MTTGKKTFLDGSDSLTIGFEEDTWLLGTERHKAVKRTAKDRYRVCSVKRYAYVWSAVCSKSFRSILVDAIFIVKANCFYLKSVPQMRF